MTASVLVLSWDAGGRGGPSARAAGLASALADDGAHVRVVTRLAEADSQPVLPGCEVHAVPDTAPVLPAVLESDDLHALAFASPALAVATRCLRDRSVELTFAGGSGTLDVARRLGRSAGLVVVDLADTTGEPGVERVAGHGAGREVGRGGDASLDAVHAVTATLPAAVLTVPTSAAADRLARHGVDAVVVPGAAPLGRRRPGPPPPSGPVRLVAAPGDVHRRAARRLRAALRAAGTTRTVTARDRDRPAVCVVLDPTGTDVVLRAAARGVPVVCVPGPAAEAVDELGCGIVVADEAGAAAACAALVADPPAAAAFGAAGVVATADAVTTASAAVRALLADRADRSRPVLRAVR